jgi:hypothetical protein
MKAANSLSRQRTILDASAMASLVEQLRRGFWERESSPRENDALKFV